MESTTVVGRIFAVRLLLGISNDGSFDGRVLFLGETRFEYWIER